MNTNNILITSDWHMGIRNSSKEWLEIQNDYFNNFFFPLIKDLKDPYLIIAGDVFDNRQSINMMIVDHVLKLFTQLKDVFKEIHIITGNHDAFLKSSNDITSLDILNNISDNIHIYKEFCVRKIADRNVLLLPWYFDKVKEKEIIKQHENSNIDFVICHSEISGFYYNTKIRVEEGSDISIFKKYKKVYSGHFHYRQSRSNVTYLGSPMHYTRNDIGDRKGIYILNNDGELFIENNYSPEFVRYNITDILEQTISDLDLDNNFVELIASDKYVEKYDLNGFLELLTTARDVKVNIIEEERKINEIVITENSKFDIIDLCDIYMTDNNFSVDEKDKSLKYIKQLYNKVLV